MRRAPGSTSSTSLRSARFPDAILYPTLVFGKTIEEKTSHIEPLKRLYPLRMGFVDPGSVNLTATGEDGKPFPTDWVYANSPADIAYKFELCKRLGLGPGMAIFEPGFLRMALAWARAGAMPQGAFLRFYFGGESSYRGPGQIDLLFGLPPTRVALDVYLEMLGDVELPWSIAVVSGEPFEGGVARHALEREATCAWGSRTMRGRASRRTSSSSRRRSRCVARSGARSRLRRRRPRSCVCRADPRSRSDTPRAPSAHV